MLITILLSSSYMPLNLEYEIGKTCPIPYNIFDVCLQSSYSIKELVVSELCNNIFTVGCMFTGMCLNNITKALFSKKYRVYKSKKFFYPTQMRMIAHKNFKHQLTILPKGSERVLDDMIIKTYVEKGNICEELYPILREEIYKDLYEVISGNNKKNK